MKKTVTLKDGKKAVIRPLHKDDSPKKLADYINAIIDENTFLSMDKKVTVKEESEWLKKKLRKMKEKSCFTILAFVDGDIAGNCRIERGLFKERGNAEIGISVSKRFRGLGLGDALLEEIIRLGRSQMKPKRIFLTVMGINKVGLSLYRKHGFEQIAVLPGWMKHRGKYVDKVYMELKG